MDPTKTAEAVLDKRPAIQLLNLKIREAQVAMEEARRNYLRVVAATQTACTHSEVAEVEEVYFKPHWYPARRVCLHCGLVEEEEDKQYILLHQPRWVMGRADLEDIHHGPIIGVGSKKALELKRVATVADLIEDWREKEHRIWTPPDYHDYQNPPTFREELDRLYPLKHEKKA